MPDSPAKVFGRRLRELRDGQGLTQEALASRVDGLGVPMERSAVARIESAKRKVTVDEAMAFAAALDVPLLSLLLPEAGDVALAPKVSIPFPFARAWMSGQLPLSREGVDSYRQAARRLPLGVSNADFNSLVNAAGDKKRKREMLLALIERERRDLAELERIAEMRPELAAALEDIRESIAYKERKMK